MKQLPAWANWLARDRDGELYAHRTKPWKSDGSYGEWENEEDKYLGVTNYEKDADGTYSHIRWSDKEPTPVVRAENEQTTPTVSEMEIDDTIRPDHYKGQIDRFEVWEKSYTEEQCRGAYKGVIDRYVSRYDRKNGVEDLYKAKESLERLIKWEESK